MHLELIQRIQVTNKEAAIIQAKGDTVVTVSRHGQYLTVNSEF